MKTIKNIFYFIAVALFFSQAYAKDSVRSIKKVVAGNAMIESIVKKIAKDDLQVFSPMPPAMCPGHFDIRAKDMVFLADAHLFIRQGFEKWVEALNKPMKKNSHYSLVTIPVKGNWMEPENHIMASKMIMQELCRISPENEIFFKENLNSYIEEIRSVEKNIKKIKVSVICSSLQEPFLRWLGCRIISAYGRPEELTPSQMMTIIDSGKEQKVSLIVDNLQSGPFMGKTMAKEIKASHVTLTNFPLNGSYLESLKENVNAIIEALVQ